MTTTRKLFLSLGGIVVLALAGFAAFQLSPWPGVLLIRRSFATGGHRTAQALARHVPDGVGARLDLRYGTGEDERLDVFHPPVLAGGAQPALTIVWIHGGGWVAGCKEDIANYARILASHGHAVVALEYSRAPGAAYPTPLRQVFAALAWLGAHAPELGLDAARLVLAGDSAGAHIAAQVANLVSAPAYARLVGVEPSLTRASLAGVLLFCGAYDVALANLDGPFGNFLRTVLWAYSGRKDFRSDPRFESAWVLHHVTPAFPPTFVSAGNGDPLALQSQALAEALVRQGVRVESLFFPADHVPALPHEYQFDLDTPDGRLALERALAFLASLDPLR